MKIKPVLHRLIVLPDKVEDADDLIKRAKAAGLEIELDKREQRAMTTGTVVSIGSTAYKHQFGSSAEEQGIAEGSHILFEKYAGGAVPNTEFILLNDEDVLGVLEDE